MSFRSSAPIRAAPSVSPRERMADRLGIVAGGGDLPRYLVECCRAAGRDVFVLALEGAAAPITVKGVQHAWCRLGAAATGLALLRENQVTELVLAGGIRRPSFAALRPDWRAAKLFARIGYRSLGDDGLLSAVIKELEQEGFRVLGADQLLECALVPEGPLGRLRPDRQSQADIERGLRVARTLGALDVGQAVIVQQGLVLGVEASEGTDELLRRCAALRREGLGGVLVKVEKPGQEPRVDRPTIGPRTIVLAAETRLAGVAVEAIATIVIDRDEVIRAADQAGLFVVGVQ